MNTMQKQLLKPLAVAVGLSLSGGVWAASYISSGPNMTYGHSSNYHSIFSNITNPANAAAAADIDSRMGVGIGFSGSFEDNAVDDLEDGATTTSDQIGEDMDFSSIDAILSPLNTTLAKVGESFFLKGTSDVAFVGTWATRRLGGLTFSVNNNLQGRFALLSKKGISTDADAINTLIIKQASGAYSTDATLGLSQDEIDTREQALKSDIINTLVMDTGLYFKYGSQTEVALDYGRYLGPVWWGDVYLGVRPKMVSVSLGKQVSSLRKYLQASTVDKDKDPTAKDAGDMATDDIEGLKDAATTTDAFGLDVGMVWQFPLLSVGVTVDNIIPMSFKYNEIPFDCSIYAAGSAESSNCALAKYYRDQLNLSEEYKMDPHVRLDGSIYTPGRTLMVGASYDVTPTTDMMGGEYQWASIQASFANETDFTDEDGFDPWSLLRMLMPDFRAGYKTNLAPDGNDISLIEMGLTIGFINLDFAFDKKFLDFIADQDNPTPEIAMGSVSFELYF